MTRCSGASLLAFICASACGYASLGGDPLDDGRIDLPSRGGADADTDGSDEEPIDPIADAGDGDVKPLSTTCAVAGLVLCYRFEDKVLDESLEPLTPAVAGGITFVDGKEGRAALFTTASALRFAPNPAFELPNDGATIEAWIKRENIGADAVVFDGDGRFSLTINAAGNVWCKSGGGAVTGTTVVPTNDWAHVACVIEAGTPRAYMNGVVDAEGAGAVGTNPTLGAAIGGNSPEGEPFVGAIDSFRVFRSARSAAEIAAAAAK